MITLYYIYKSKIDGKYYEAKKFFLDVMAAYRFMQKFKNQFYHFEWACDDPEDNEWLWSHWHSRLDKKNI